MIDALKKIYNFFIFQILILCFIILISFIFPNFFKETNVFEYNDNLLSICGIIFITLILAVLSFSTKYFVNNIYIPNYTKNTISLTITNFIILLMFMFLVNLTNLNLSKNLLTILSIVCMVSFIISFIFVIIFGFIIFKSNKAEAAYRKKIDIILKDLDRNKKENPILKIDFNKSLT